MQRETLFPAGANPSSVTVLMAPHTLSNIWMASVHLPDAMLQLCTEDRGTFYFTF